MPTWGTQQNTCLPITLCVQLKRAEPRTEELPEASLFALLASIGADCDRFGAQLALGARVGDPEHSRTDN